jgi:hypothetical protein
MAEKTPAFHEAYDDLVAGLPPSQLREAYKRLSTAKVPLTDEEICSEHPRVLATLERLASAYIRKKQRSAIASKARREAAKEPVEPVEPVMANEEPVAALLEACSLSLEPVEVECAAPPPATPATPETGSPELTRSSELTTPAVPPHSCSPELKKPAKRLIVTQSLLRKPSPHADSGSATSGKVEAAVTVPVTSGRKFFTNQI